MFKLIGASIFLLVAVLAGLVYFAVRGDTWAIVILTMLGTVLMMVLVNLNNLLMSWLDARRDAKAFELNTKENLGLAQQQMKLMTEMNRATITHNKLRGWEKNPQLSLPSPTVDIVGGPGSDIPNLFDDEED